MSDSNFANDRGITEYSHAAMVNVLPIPPEEHLYKFLKNGASLDLRVDGDPTPVDFKYTCPTGKVAVIQRCVIAAQDVSIKLHEFLGMGAVLSNGVLVSAHDDDDASLVDYLDGDAIVSTHGFSVLGSVDAPVVTQAGVDPDTFTMRWTLGQNGTGHPLMLSAGQYLRVRIQDDLSTGIALFRWFVQGRVYTL